MNPWSQNPKIPNFSLKKSRPCNEKPRKIKTLVSTKTPQFENFDLKNQLRKNNQTQKNTHFHQNKNQNPINPTFQNTKP